MTERATLVSDFFAENIGPKGGTKEELPLDRDPQDDYITGVIVPKDSFDPEADIESQFEDNLVTLSNHDVGDDLSSGTYLSSIKSEVSNIPSPTMNPSQRPCSFGMSFMIKGESPTVNICCTGATYPKSSEGISFQRKGWSWIKKGISVDQDGSFTFQPGAKLYIVSSRIEKRKAWKVSIYLVNINTWKERSRAPSKICFFQ